MPISKQLKIVMSSRRTMICISFVPNGFLCSSFAHHETAKAKKEEESLIYQMINRHICHCEVCENRTVFTGLRRLAILKHELREKF